MYRGSGDTVQGLASLGLPADLAGHFVDDDLDVWPENWPALELFSVLGTQWRVGMAGATGLDYTAILAVMDLQHTAPEDRRGLFDDVRVMERAALQTMAEQAKR